MSGSPRRGRLVGRDVPFHRGQLPIVETRPRSSLRSEIPEHSLVNNQKVARPTRGDVLRVAARDFPGDQSFEALRLLDACAAGEDERIRDRVHAAVLKLASGDIGRLRKLIETANADIRDVVAPAEYPRYLDTRNPIGLSARQQQDIFDADWAQYQAWLTD